MNSRIGRMLVMLVMALVLSCGLASTAPSAASNSDDGQFSTDPELRLDLGQHSAKIWWVDVDAKGQFLVTGSDDKTARVWAIPQRPGERFQLKQVLRPPIGSQYEGEIWAAAMSPDGANVAIGGWTGAYSTDGDDNLHFVVYVFDRQTGHLSHVLKDLSQPVSSLAFSRRGDRLVAGLGSARVHTGHKGIVVWDTKTWHELGHDFAYDDTVYGLDFDKDGRLATASFDGKIRLYTNDEWSKPALPPVTAPGGTHPYGIIFDPSGERLAVGYNDTHAVSIIDSRTLKLLYAAPEAGANGSLTKLAWSPDGQSLYAGNRSRDSDYNDVIRIYKDAGRTFEREVPVSVNSIHGLATLPNGDVVFGAEDPIIGLLHADSTVVVTSVGSNHIDMRPTRNQKRSGQKALRVSKGGTEISVPFDAYSDYYLRFSADKERLDVLQSEATDLKGPILSAPGIDITNWWGPYEDSPPPRLNGTVLKLEHLEISRSLAIAPSGDKFLLGTEWYLRLFDKHGIEIWHHPAPGIASRVNISGDGRLAVAAFSDGTIRWYRMSDGAALLALFATPGPKTSQWIAWVPGDKKHGIPGGYYANSPGSDGFVGWLVNQAKDKESIWSPIKTYHDRFYRTDVIRRVLETLDPVKALEHADAARNIKTATTAFARGDLLPIVGLISPRDGESFSHGRVDLQFRLQSPSGKPIASVQAIVNNRPQPAFSGPWTAGQVFKQTLTGLPRDEDVMLSLVASTQDGWGVVTPPIVLHASDAQAMSVNGTDRPTLHILAIGVSKYENPNIHSLKYADADARAFVKLMSRQKGALFKDVVSRTLVNGEATKVAIDQALDSIEVSGATAPGDLVIVFLAGHGMTIPTYRREPGGTPQTSNDWFFMPTNARPQEPNATLMPESAITNLISRVPNDVSVVVFLDACDSGVALDANARPKIPTFGLSGNQPRSIRGAADISGDQLPVMNDLSHSGAVVIASAYGLSNAYENDKFKHGLFTKVVLDGLDGLADQNFAGEEPDHVVEVRELVSYLKTKLPELEPDQRPDVRYPGNNDGEDIKLAKISAN